MTATERTDRPAPAWIIEFNRNRAADQRRARRTFRLVGAMLAVAGVAFAVALVAASAGNLSAALPAFAVATVAACAAELSAERGI